MMHVEVQVPMLDMSYEFEVDEGKAVKGLVGDIISLIEQKESVSYAGRENACLYAWGQECVLNGEESLCGQGVKNGDQLLLL